MLTLFSIPKPFIGEAAVHQWTALSSWVALGVEVILFGDEDGIANTAMEFGVRHVPKIERTAFGTPLLDGAFRQARALASTRYLCYSNADDVLLADFLDALGRIHFPRFLAIGRRWEVTNDDRLDLRDEAMRRELLSRPRRLQNPHAMDYFVFPTPMDWDMPPFAVGRPWWDGWLADRALMLDVPLIDLTPSVTVLHQSHGYEHVPQRSGRRFEGPEADANRLLSNNKTQPRCVWDATHLLTSEGALPSWRRRVYVRQRLVRLGERNAALGMIVRAVLRIADAVRGR